MKNLFLICLLACAVLVGASFKNADNYFSGKITYTNTIVGVSDETLLKQIKASLGEEQLYYINSANYKSYFKENELMQLYNSATNTYYANPQRNNEIMVIDASKATENCTVTPGTATETILGYPCQSVVIKGAQTTTTYYFSPAIKVNAATYAKHNFGNWNKYMEASKGALPLKYSIDYGMFTMVITATKIEEMDLDNAAFDIEKIVPGYKTAKENALPVGN
jgi:hypothetical protein